MSDRQTADSLPFALRIVDLGREMRAEEPVLLDVRSLVDYTDFFLILTGRSSRQNLAMAEHVVRSLKTAGRYAISKAGLESGSWICLDMGDAVVHVFDPPTRERYDLELLWADAPRIDLPARIPAVAPAAAPAVAEPRPAARKRSRVVRSAAVEDADAANAPDAERPPDDEEEPAPKPLPAPKPAKTSKTRPVAPKPKKSAAQKLPPTKARCAMQRTQKKPKS